MIEFKETQYSVKFEKTQKKKKKFGEYKKKFNTLSLSLFYSLFILLLFSFYNRKNICYVFHYKTIIYNLDYSLFIIYIYDKKRIMCFFFNNCFIIENIFINIIINYNYNILIIYFYTFIIFII